MSQTAMPEPSPLSPAANAVLNAFLTGNWESTKDRQRLAAALRAAADQVVPLPHLPYDSCCDVSASAIRAELLALAAELEGHD